MSQGLTVAEPPVPVEADASCVRAIWLAMPTGDSSFKCVLAASSQKGSQSGWSLPAFGYQIRALRRRRLEKVWWAWCWFPSRI